MATELFKQECKKSAYENRYGTIKIGEPAELTGATISITDAQEHNALDFKLSKLSTQYTTTGANLYNYKDTSSVNQLYSVDDDGWITATYNNTGSSTIYLNYFTNNLKVNYSTNYNLLTEIKNVSGTGTLYLVSTSDDYGQFTNTISYLFPNLSNGNIKKNIITSKASGGTGINSGLRSYLRFGAGESGSITFRISVIANTSITPETFIYEPYTNGASPNPEYPQEVKVVNGYRNLLKNTSTNSGDNNYWYDYSTYDEATGTITKKTSATTETFLKHGYNFKAGTVYTLSFLAKSNGYVKNIDIMALNSNASKVYAVSVLYLTTEFQKIVFTFTTENNVDYTNGYIRFDNNGSTTSGTEAILTIKDVMLVEGSTENAYVPCDNTNYINIIDNGSNNIFKPTLLNYVIPTRSEKITQANCSVVLDGDTFKLTATGTDMYFGQVRNTGSSYINTLGLLFDVSDVSSVSFYLTNPLFVNNYFTTYDENLVSLGYVIKHTSSGTYDLPSGAKYLSFRFGLIATTGTTYETKVMLVKGSTVPTEYETYKEKLIPIPLNNNFIGGISTYKDQLLVDKDGHCYLNKKIGKYVYTGNDSERWTFINSNNNNYLFQSLGVNIQIENYSTTYLCSHALPNSASSASGYVGSYVYNNIFRLRVPNTIATTSTEFSTWLVSNNVELYYPLPEPQLIDLNYTVDLELFSGINYITNSENADMSMTYAKEVELNQSNKIQEFSIDDGCYIDGNIVGSVYAKKLNTQLIDALENTIEDMECNVSVGVKYHEPYDEPYEIEGSTSQETTTGKNKFNNTINASQGNADVITDTTINTGKKLTWTNSSSLQWQFLSYVIMDLTNYVGKTIRFKSDFVASGSNKGRYYIGLCNADGTNRTSKATTDNSGTTIDFVVPTLSGSQKYLLLNLYINTDGTIAQNNYINYTNMILTIDNSDMTFEPYTYGPTPNPNFPQPIINKTGHITETINNEPYEFDLGDIELCKIGDYEDIIFKNETASPYYDNTLDLNEWYIKKNIGKVVLKGTENWTYTSGTSARFGVGISNLNSDGISGHSLSNYYRSLNSLTDDIYGIKVYANWIDIRDARYTVASNYKTWLSTHNLIVYYVLATPTYTKITDELLIEELNSGAEPYEYIKLGKYIVDKPTDEQTANYTSFVAYDLLLQHLEEPYVTELDFENNTITIADVYTELCLRLGLIPVTTTFTNSTITVENNPFVNGEANRVVLNAIAKVACAFVDIDYDNNKIDLKWLSNTLNYTFNTGDYSTLECGKTIYGPINSLVIKSSFSDSENVSISDAQSIAENGEHQLVITGDYFLYDATKRQMAATEIWAKVNGLTYTECDLTTYTGKPFLKVGDKIRVYTDENTYIDSYVLQHTFTYDGSFKSVIKCPVLTEQQVQTKQDISLAEKLSNTEIIVNKQNGTITSLASRTKKLENNEILTNNKFNDYTPLSRTVDLETSVSDIQTDTYKKTEVKQILKGEFYDEQNNRIVSEIVKTASATFDENGMTYEKDDTPVKTTINEIGIRTSTIEGNNTVLFAGYVEQGNTEYRAYEGQTIVATENVIVKNYFVMPEAHSRIEKYGNGGGMFYV